MRNSRVPKGLKAFFRRLVLFAQLGVGLSGVYNAACVASEGVSAVTKRTLDQVRRNATGVELSLFKMAISDVVGSSTQGVLLLSLPGFIQRFLTFQLVKFLAQFPRQDWVVRLYQLGVQPQGLTGRIPQLGEGMLGVSTKDVEGCSSLDGLTVHPADVKRRIVTVLPIFHIKRCPRDFGGFVSYWCLTRERPPDTIGHILIL